MRPLVVGTGAPGYTSRGRLLLTTPRGVLALDGLVIGGRLEPIARHSVDQRERRNSDVRPVQVMSALAALEAKDTDCRADAVMPTEMGLWAPTFRAVWQRRLPKHPAG